MDNISLPYTTIEEWVESYGDPLYKYAYAKTGDIHTAEDLVQEAFLAALQSYSQTKEIKNQKSKILAFFYLTQ
jgi:DNA-directed RNA polymerase specialized sigma24 family protein